MADSKLSALSAAGAYDDADLLYIVQSGVSYKTTWGGLKAAVLSAVTLYPEVANYAALPAAASHTGEVYLVLAAQGTRWLFTLKDAGLYVSDGADWDYVGPIPANYFTDSVMEIADDSDPTKICKFQLSSITTATTRTLTVPDASGTIMLVGNAPTAHAASHTNGTDDIQNATSGQKGLMTSTAMSKLDGIEAAADVTDATNVAAAGAVMYGTLTSNVTLGEDNGQVVLDAALSADGKWSGICEAGTAGATLAFGDLCYLAVADSRWELTDADAEATAGPVKLGICVLAAASDGSATTMLLWGKVRADAAFPAMTIGAPVYVSTTAGDLQVAQPSGTDDVIRIVGYANTADELFFCPDPSYMTHT